MAHVENEVEELASNYWTEEGDATLLLAFYCEACGVGHLPKLVVCSNCGRL